MAIVIIRRNQGKFLKEKELADISLTDNPVVDRMLNQVMMRVNREGEQDGSDSTEGGHLY